MNDVIEDNKLIAEFMGWPRGAKIYEQDNCFEMPKNLTVDSRHPGATMCMDIALQFNTSWDWLMPVIDKIEDIEQMGCQAYITFHPFCVEAYCPGNLQRGLSEFSYQLAGKKFSGSAKIEAVYEAVVEFVKWYNNTK